jgi:hypothetical protein
VNRCAKATRGEAACISQKISLVDVNNHPKTVAQFFAEQVQLSRGKGRKVRNKPDGRPYT